MKYNFDEKWSVFGEAQLRSLELYNHFHYYEFKGGIDYRVHPNIKLTMGTGDYNTYKEGGNFILPKNNDEYRVWPQVVVLQSISKIKMEHRYRAELRFNGNGYRNRFRYRLGLSYLFGAEKKGYKPYQISASDELFFTDKEPYFERNRLLFSFNYRASKASSFQIGYLRQFDYKIYDETGKAFLQIGAYLELFRRQSDKSTNSVILKDN